MMETDQALWEVSNQVIPSICTVLQFPSQTTTIKVPELSPIYRCKAKPGRVHQLDQVTTTTGETEKCGFSTPQLHFLIGVS